MSQNNASMQNQFYNSYADAQKALRLELTRLGVEADALIRLDELLSDFSQKSNTRTFVMGVARLLNHKATLLRQFNIVLAGTNASLSVVEEQPGSPSSPILVILITQNGSYGEIIRLPAPALLGNEYMTTTTLRSSLHSENFSQQMEHLPPLMASCIMDLILLELRSMPMHRRMLNRHLRHLAAAHGVFPPSFLIYNVEQEGRFPVANGGFADIYKGWLKSYPVCLKVLRYFTNATPRDHERLLKRLCREALAWKQLDHPNIVPFIGIAADLFRPSFCLISPWMNNGNIVSFLEHNPTYDRLKAVIEIAQAIKYLHEQDPPIVHADIRGANILVTDDLRCCLTDFGLTYLSDTQTSSAASQGSLRWMAPEYLQSDAPHSSLPPRDVYAFGCTMLEIYTGKKPFYYYRRDALVLTEVFGGKRPRRDDFQPDQMWSLIESCWNQDPNRRPSAESVLAVLLPMSSSS